MQRRAITSGLNDSQSDRRWPILDCVGPGYRNFRAKKGSNYANSNSSHAKVNLTRACKDAD